MISLSDSCLVEAKKRGFSLRYDPSGVGNRCFYSCLGRFLKLDDSKVVDMVEKYMLENQFIPVENEVFMLRCFPWFL